MKFKNGETIYHVHAFPASGKFWIDKVVVVVASATMQHINVPSLIVRKTGRNSTDEISLQDANVTPNKYNCHRIFKAELEANAYVANPSLWRPLGYTAEEWNDFAKADYLADKEYWSTSDEI